jgi:hypothetical protein
MLSMPRRTETIHSTAAVMSLAEARLTKSAVSRVSSWAISLVFFGTGILAMAQGSTEMREPRVIDPILTEESLPEDAGECNLRTTAAYHAGVELVTVLPRTQLFCGFSRRWGGEIDVPMVRVDGRYGPGDVGATVKYKLREPTSRWPALVFGLETTLPTQRRSHDTDTNESGVEVQPFVAVLKQVRGLTIQGNIGLGIRHSASRREYRAAYNGAWLSPCGIQPSLFSAK